MEDIVENLNLGSRKKTVNRQNWTKNRQKAGLYRPKNACVVLLKCKHQSNKTYKCRFLKPQWIKRFFNSFYGLKTKVEQDTYALMFVRDGSNKEREESVRNVLKYFIPTPEGEFQVCAGAFAKILQISIQRVQRLFKRTRTTGAIPKEGRGGNRKKEIFATRKQSIIAFINQLPGCEAHYGRSKSKRVYLSSELNITKLWTMHKDQHPEHKVCYPVFNSY